jgi:acyl-CoA reductase-like NAD-dependent aldehyde dehydrogenase
MSETITVQNPYSGAEIATLPLQSAQDAERLLAQAYARYQNRKSWMPKHERIAVLKKLASLMEHNRDKLLIDAISEGGKPYKDSVVEVDRAIQGVHIAIETLAHMGGHEIPMGLTAGSAGRMAYTLREPYGIVVSVSAFNHPLNLIVHQTVPAFAVGAPVIVKPALTTPLSCLNLVNLFREAGAPEDYVSAIICENDVAQKLVTDRRVGYFSFIGSAKVGWYLRSQLAPGVRCALEHGGAAPVIIAPDYEIEKCIAPIAKGGFYHAGQVCVSVQRVYVPKEKAEIFAQKLAEAGNQMIVGDSLDPKTDVGPLILPREVDRIHEWVQEAIQSGGKLISGGNKLPNNCYQTTVILTPSDNAILSKNEIFGPVIAVYGYETLEEAYHRANDVDYSFQSAVFTDQLSTAMEAVHHLDAQTVLINDHTAFRVDWMPFGGSAVSGLGLGGIPYSMEEMTRPKMMVIKPN